MGLFGGGTDNHPLALTCCALPPSLISVPSPTSMGTTIHHEAAQHTTQTVGLQEFLHTLLRQRGMENAPYSGHFQHGQWVCSPGPRVPFTPTQISLWGQFCSPWQQANVPPSPVACQHGLCLCSSLACAIELLNPAGNNFLCWEFWTALQLPNIGGPDMSPAGETVTEKLWQGTDVGAHTQSDYLWVDALLQGTRK
jgi:hypothetical protein